MIGGRRTGATLASIALALLGGCASSADEAADDATTVPVATGPLTPLEESTACARTFQAFRQGDTTLARTFADGTYGLTVGEEGCFVTHHDGAGNLIEVADVSFERVEGVATVAEVVWSTVGSFTDQLADRLMKSVVLVQPGEAPTSIETLIDRAGTASGTSGSGTAAGAGSVDGSGGGGGSSSVPGGAVGGGSPQLGGPGITGPAAEPPTRTPGAPTSPGTPSAPGATTIPGGSPTPGGATGPGTSTPASNPTPVNPGVPAGNSTLPPVPPTDPPRSSLDYYQLAELQAQCVYEGNGSACATLEANGFGAAGNYGLGTALTSADEAALVEDCSASFRLGCLELERRFPPAAGDGGVATEFVNSVIAGSPDSAAAVASPGLLTYVPILRSGPFTAVPGADIPGTVFTADGNLTFRIGGSTIVRCYVGSGSVRHCAVAVG